MLNVNLLRTEENFIGPMFLSKEMNSQRYIGAYICVQTTCAVFLFHRSTDMKICFERGVSTIHLYRGP